MIQTTIKEEDLESVAYNIKVISNSLEDAQGWAGEIHCDDCYRFSTDVNSFASKIQEVVTRAKEIYGYILVLIAANKEVSRIFGIKLPNPAAAFAAKDRVEKRASHDSDRLEYLSTLFPDIDFDNKDADLKQKAMRALDLYGETIYKYSRLYGVDPSAILAIASLEHGTIGEISDNGGMGPMQLQQGVVDDPQFQLLLPDGTKRYLTQYELQHLTDDVEVNIMIGVGIFKESLDWFDDNYTLAAEGYNKGNYKNADLTLGATSVLERYSRETEIPKKDMINDPYFLIRDVREGEENEKLKKWTECCTYVAGGPEYVSKYMNLFTDYRMFLNRHYISMFSLE